MGLLHMHQRKNAHLQAKVDPTRIVVSTGIVGAVELNGSIHIIFHTLVRLDQCAHPPSGQVAK